MLLLYCFALDPICHYQLYEGQSINSDSGSISQKILIKSELFVTLNVDICVVYLSECLNCLYVKVCV